MMLIALFACDATSDDAPATGEDAVDLRLREGDFTPPSATGETWYGPDVVVGPGQDVMYFLFGTYTGPDRGVHTLTTWQAEGGHHLVLMGTTASDLDYPDGTVVDCTQTNAVNMTDLEPMVLPTAAYVSGEPLATGFDIPDGTAVKLDEGQRWVLQAHYLNTGTEPVRVRDVAVLEYIEEDEVETWAAPMVLNDGDFVIPPGESATKSIDCAFQTDWNVLYLLGHMHEWGSAIRVEAIDGETVTTIYDQPEWEPSYRDAPPTNTYAPGEFLLPATTTLRLTCEWFNDTDEPLEFPHEMCVSVGMVYPQLTPAICDGGEVE
jgi:hypothetical protein